MRRAARAERAIIDSWRASTSPTTHLLHAESGMSRLFLKHPESMTALARYEAALDRAFSRALALLERHQARHRGGSVSPLVTVLVENADGAAKDDANRLARNAKNENYETNPIAVETPRIARAAPALSDD